MAMMKCPQCGKSMQVGGTCPNCGYVDKSGKSGGGKNPFPPKKAPSKGKAPAKKKGSVPPQFLKKGTAY